MELGTDQFNNRHSMPTISGNNLQTTDFQNDVIVAALNKLGLLGPDGSGAQLGIDRLEPAGLDPFVGTLPLSPPSPEDAFGILFQALDNVFQEQTSKVSIENKSESCILELAFGDEKTRHQYEEPRWIIRLMLQLHEGYNRRGKNGGTSE